MPKCYPQSYSVRLLIQPIHCCSSTFSNFHCVPAKTSGRHIPWQNLLPQCTADLSSTKKHLCSLTCRSDEMENVFVLWQRQTWCRVLNLVFWRCTCGSCHTNNPTSFTFRIAIKRELKLPVTHTVFYLKNFVFHCFGKLIAQRAISCSQLKCIRCY